MQDFMPLKCDFTVPGAGISFPFSGSSSGMGQRGIFHSKKFLAPNIFGIGMRF